MKGRLSLLFLILLLGMQLTVFSQADDREYREYSVKAALLRQISHFIDWPADSEVNDTTKPFVIGVIGKNPFGPSLERIYKEEEGKIKEKSVEIRYISGTEQIPGCHLLFISRSKRKELSDILAFTRDKPILTVGDTRGFAEKGVLINFYVKEGSVKFEANVQGFEETGLKVNYHLLRYAKPAKEAEKERGERAQPESGD